MSGTYTIDDLARHLEIPDSDSSQGYIMILRDLVDRGTVPPPQD